MKKVYRFATKPKFDPKFWEISRSDLDDDEVKVYDSFLPRLNNSRPDELLMLAAYAWSVVEFQKATASGDKDLADHMRRCMIYSRNGLGLWRQEHASYFGLLLDCYLPGHQDWPPVDCCLKREWQYGEDS